MGIREVKILNEIRHAHIIGLLDTFVHRGALHMVYDFMDGDLARLLKAPSELSAGDIKAFLGMLLRAVHACHSAWILHRDIKPENILMSATGDYKLCDFGLAKYYAEDSIKAFSPGAVTRWYRPPELLFGARQYGTHVDMWSVGCIFAEFFLRRALFPGDTELDVLALIFGLFGAPSEGSWPGVTELPNYIAFRDIEPAKPPAKALKWMLGNASDAALSLMSEMLALNPNKRISAEQALLHSYFSLDPAATPGDRLPRPKRVHSVGAILEGQTPAQDVSKGESSDVPRAKKPKHV
eukprot:NODE_381_length_1002_cov_549.683106_g296_i0.p1 GENE.NODE_381_length_1002_cov_549.683106_g296_i0~~NODE_381_length_1002_cov_549.683106_g296_i0.p1  ORF type:complete len:304 (-),score=49.35 NODE_381_length_1002_cov_549.683106_g296_i0:89-973(-)